MRRSASRRCARSSPTCARRRRSKRRRRSARSSARTRARARSASSGSRTRRDARAPAPRRRRCRVCRLRREERGEGADRADAALRHAPGLEAADRSRREAHAQRRAGLHLHRAEEEGRASRSAHPRRRRQRRLVPPARHARRHRLPRAALPRATGADVVAPRGGPKDGELWEAVVQEVDVATRKLLFEWHSLPHVAVSESYEHMPEEIPYDYFHINSVAPDGPDRLLISGRHVSAIYEIRKSDGAVVWRLGGKKSDFTMGRGTHFAWQHDARRLSDGTISLFDNAAEHPGEAKESKVLVVRLDETKRTAELVRSYTRPKPLLSTSQGNAQFLPDGHVLVGWGANPFVTEFSRDGRVLLDLAFGNKDVDSYRAFKDEWVGRPADRPRAVVREGRLYVSWNGATDVARWRVLAGGKRVAEFSKSGFETSETIPSRARSVVVQALDASGRVLGSSGPARVP